MARATTPRTAWLLSAVLLGFLPSLWLTIKLQSALPVAVFFCGFLVFILSAVVGDLVAAPPLAVGPLRWALRSFLHLPQLPWQAWILRRAARAFGWNVRWWQWPRDIHGAVDGVQMCLGRAHLAALERPLEIVVPGLSPEIEIGPEGLGRRVGRAFGACHVETGDPAFDRALYVKGQPEAALALLDGETRRTLTRLAGHWRVHLKEGGLSLAAGLVPGSAGDLIRAARDLATLSRSLGKSGAAFERLTHSALSDPVVGVRRNSIDTLLRHRRRSADVLRQALSDPSAEVRVHAAAGLGTEAHATLLAILDDPTASPECAAQAVRDLAEHLPESRTIRLLESTIASDREPVVRAAVDALALTGSAAAVPALRAAVDGHPLDLGLRRAASKAIARIQSRLTGAEAGQVSVADDESGQLAIADSDAGRLSLDEPSALPTRQTPSAAGEGEG
jgi:hypothetical protein